MFHPSLSTWFAHPALLGTLAAVPFVSALWLYAWLRRRRALANLGNGLAIRRLLVLRAGSRRWRALCLLTGITLLALTCAGPQWGRAYDQGRAASGDVVVVLDLSRSMQAEQPSRQERALRLLHNLADALQERGGRRVALVVFAAEPRLVFPLTQDYDHFRHWLDRIAKDDLPPLVPGPDTPMQSGTRIGAALRLAVATADVAHDRRPALLLLSDGDDPAAADQEWLAGAQEARTHGIPIYTVGIGDPDAEHTIGTGADVLRYRGTVVRTKLNERLLEEIARRTGGTYLPAHTHSLPLGAIVANLRDQQADTEDADDALPVYRPQYVWFLAPGVLLLMLSLLCNEAPVSPRRRRPASAVAAALALALVSAGGPGATDALVRQGNAAFAAGDFETALACYAQAEGRAADPGLVAFNQAAACFRVGRYADAVAGYRQCLEDDQAPAERRARAHYDLGTALVKQSGGASAPLLRQAVGAFRACLAQPALDDDLVKDARHNLELAQLLWLKARAANPKDDDDSGDRLPESRPNQKGAADSQKKDGSGDGSKNGADPATQPGDAGQAQQGDGDRKELRGDALHVLPDSDEVRPLPPADADDWLARIAERIARERRQHWQQSARPAKDARNW